ncbi:MAG: leucine-rich repeat protein [Oscillospiraceae bacterium]|nr:leucine-rich repeat protein [Oscillospiraceae bacterium]
MKRLLSLAIAVCIIIGITTVAPIYVGAVETQKVTTGTISGDYKYELLDDGTAKITKYYGSDIDITIPSQIAGYTVTTIGDDAFYNCTNLTSITIPDSVTTIGGWAFEDCTSLTNIKIPDSVTTIGFGAFTGCTSLTSITIPDSVTTIGGSAFEDCTNLTNITIPYSVTTVGRDAFNDTAWYNNQPEGLVYAGKVAYEYKGDCPYEVIIKDGTKGIGGSAFCGCEFLTSITIPDSVTTIGDSAFSGCRSLTNITIPDSVTTIGDSAFSYCTILTNITIGNGVTTIGGSAFRYCESLTSITIPEGVTTIGYGAFYYCKNLTNIAIPDSITTIGNDAFIGTAWYNNQPDGLVYAGKVVYNYKGECPSEVIVKDGTIGFGDYAFMNCASLTRITIPDSVTTIGDWAFWYCVRLTNITIPDSVTTIGIGAFEYCTSLTSITIPDSVTSIGYGAFFDCTSLTNIIIPDSVTTIGSTAFGYYYDDNSDKYKKVKNFTIYGYPNSTAEKYAKNNGFAFLNADKIPTTVKKTTVTLAKSSATVYRTGKTAIKATVKNGKGKTTYKSSNTKVAKVTSKGVVTGVSKGTAKITVANNGVKKVFTIKVINPTLNKNSVSIKKGKTFTLKIAGKIGTAKFTSSNKKIATVNANGKITAKKKGTVTIKVKTNGITLVCKVKVK